MELAFMGVFIAERIGSGMLILMRFLARQPYYDEIRPALQYFLRNYVGESINKYMWPGTWKGVLRGELMI